MVLPRSEHVRPALKRAAARASGPSNVLEKSAFSKANMAASDLREDGKVALLVSSSSVKKSPRWLG